MILFVSPASGSPTSKGPSAPEGQKPAARGAAAGPLADVDYSDIPNTQIRRVSLLLSVIVKNPTGRKLRFCDK